LGCLEHLEEKEKVRERGRVRTWRVLIVTLAGDSDSLIVMVIIGDMAESASLLPFGLTMTKVTLTGDSDSLEVMVIIARTCESAIMPWRGRFCVLAYM